MPADPGALAYIGVGSNLDGPEGQVRLAIAELGLLPASRLLAVSPLYLTSPLGPVDQPDFVNAVAVLATRLVPRALLAALQGIEQVHGRRPDGRRWGPRPLDLDILLLGEALIEEPGLKVPHPEMASRAFVLVPLADIAPAELHIPGLGALADLLAACPRDGIRPLEAPPACEDPASLAESRLSRRQGRPQDRIPSAAIH